MATIDIEFSWPLSLDIVNIQHLLIAGEVRNDIYVTLERGEFEKGGKSVARNVEVTVYLLGGDGQVLKVRLLHLHHLWLVH